MLKRLPCSVGRGRLSRVSRYIHDKYLYAWFQQHVVFAQMSDPYDIDDYGDVNALFDQMTAPNPRIFSSPGSHRFHDEPIGTDVIRTVSVTHDLLTVHSVHRVDNITMVCVAFVSFTSTLTKS